MKRQIVTYNAIEGFHCWPNAETDCRYLSFRHRHIFVIHCWFNVTHNERQIEIIKQQHEIENYLRDLFPNQQGDGNCCDFGGNSCESIAEIILNKFTEAEKVEVLEDGYGGSTLTR